MDKSVMDEMDFAYCPRCGGSFKHRSTNCLACDTCDLHYYINPRPCNAVIITNDRNEILLARRALEPFINTWDLPGGFIETNESAEESVIREIQEELGVTVGNITYISSAYDRYIFRGLNCHTLGLIYSAKIISGIPQPKDDVSEVSYFSHETMPWDNLSFPSVRKAIEDYYRSPNH